MTKRLQLVPPVGATEYNAAIAQSSPRSDFLLRFAASDIEGAIEFWLNNVVLRHPVCVDFIEKKGTDFVICVRPCGEKQ